MGCGSGKTTCVARLQAFMTVSDGEVRLLAGFPRTRWRLSLLVWRREEDG
jgi:hypothetical protein